LSEELFSVDDTPRGRPQRFTSARGFEFKAYSCELVRLEPGYHSVPRIEPWSHLLYILSGTVPAKPCSPCLIDDQGRVFAIDREARRLASLAPGEWRLWIDRSAERLRIPRAILEDVIAAIIKNSEKKARDAFESLISLPNEQQETRLGELAKRLDEDVAAVRDHFTAFVGMQSWTASTDSWNVELWPDPVETPKLLQKISAKISARL
jgi:hypothetical protein